MEKKTVPKSMNKPLAPKPETSMWSIVAIICSLQFPLLGIIFSIVALEELKKKPYLEGKNLAHIALIISIVYIVMSILILITVFAFIFLFGAMVSTLPFN